MSRMTQSDNQQIEYSILEICNLFDNSDYIRQLLYEGAQIQFPYRCKSQMAIFKRLLALDAQTQKTVDDFVPIGYANYFERGGLTDKELFSLYLRCRAVTHFIGGVVKASKSTNRCITFTFDKECTFQEIKEYFLVSLWHEFNNEYLLLFSHMIHEYGALPSLPSN